MRKTELTQTDTATWAADSAGIRTDIVKEGVITRIDATAEVTPSATLDGANQPDGLFRVVQNLRIVGGGHTFYTLPADDGCQGGVLLHYLNLFDHGMLGHGDGGVVAPQRTYIGMTYRLHCGSRPWDEHHRDNPFDLSGVIPALHLTQLVAEWVTAGNDVMDDSVTISSAVMRFNIFSVHGTDAEINAEMMRQGVRTPAGARAMLPAWITETFAHSATKSDYSEERNIPTDGGYLRRLAILSQDATSTRTLRTEDTVTGVKIAVHGEEIVKAYVDPWLNQRGPSSFQTADEDAVDFGNHVAEGVIVKDLRPHGNPDYGLNLMGLQSGAAKLGLTITTYASGDDSLILYDRYKPYFGTLGL